MFQIKFHINDCFTKNKNPTLNYSPIQLQRFTHTLFINIDIEHIMLIVCKLMHKVNYQSKSCLLGLTKAKLEKINHNLNEVWIKAEARNCYLCKWVLIISYVVSKDEVLPSAENVTKLFFNGVVQNIWLEASTFSEWLTTTAA